MKTRLAKLLSVKSIITISLTIVFSILCLRGDLDPQYFIGVFSTVIAFYFGTQATKDETKKEEE